MRGQALPVGMMGLNRVRSLDAPMAIGSDAVNELTRKA